MTLSVTGSGRAGSGSSWKQNDYGLQNTGRKSCDENHMYTQSILANTHQGWYKGGEYWFLPTPFFCLPHRYIYDQLFPLPPPQQKICKKPCIYMHTYTHTHTHTKVVIMSVQNCKESECMYLTTRSEHSQPPAASSMVGMTPAEEDQILTKWNFSSGNIDRMNHHIQTFVHFIEPSITC